MTGNFTFRNIIKPEKKIRAGMKTSPVTTFFTISADTASRYIDFNSQELHWCSPNCVRQFMGKCSHTAILCNHGDPGAKCRGNILQTQFLSFVWEPEA